MGCCASRPVDSEDARHHDHHTPQPQVRQSPQAITSETAINPTSIDRQPQALEPPSTISLHQSETSRSALSTPRQSTTNSRNRSQPVELADHYNLPLQPPKPWTSKSRTWTRTQLRRERYEFFETRVTGRREIWAALKQVAECIRDSDIDTAQGILDAVGVTLPTGRMEEGGYDEAGNLYRVPQAVLSDPTNLVEEDGDEQTMVGTVESKEAMKEADDDGASKETTEVPTKEEKGKAAIYKDALKVKCRLSDRGGSDIVVLLGRTQLVGALIQSVRDEGEIPSAARIRIAYLGQILNDKQALLEQGWQEGHVVNALISGLYSG